MQVEDVVREAQAELLHIPPRPLATPKLPPRREEILNAYYFMKNMIQSRPHIYVTLAGATPRARATPILEHVTKTYELWQSFLPHMAKTSRYTLGAKIDAALLETIELMFVAAYVSRERKAPYLERASAKLDLLKVFVQIAWEVRALDDKKYAAFAERLQEIGRMTGGWLKQTRGDGFTA
ncbi:MAG: four helix bundle protein [Candidatus Rokubacteria bacterium]|nr:four helix bundle protein [Candidatus Rokubacteria bacterium]